MLTSPIKEQPTKGNNNDSNNYASDNQSIHILSSDMFFKSTEVDVEIVKRLKERAE